MTTRSRTPWQRALVILAASAGWTAFSAVPAEACQCVQFPGATSQERRENHLRAAETVVRGRVTAFSMADPGNGNDMEAVATFAVADILKGAVPATFELRALGGDEGANCGLASQLFRALSAQAVVTLQVGPYPDRPGSFAANSCGYFDAPWLRAPGSERRQP